MMETVVPVRSGGGRSLFPFAAAVAGAAAIAGTIASLGALEAELPAGLVALIFASGLACLLVAGLMHREIRRFRRLSVIGGTSHPPVQADAKLSVGTMGSDAEAKADHWRNVLALALEAAHAGAWEYDVKTKTSTWSDELCALLGMPDVARSASYERWLGMVHPEDREHVRQLLGEAFHGESSLNTEYRMILPDGQLRHFHDIGRVLRDGAGNPERLVGFQIDITDRVHAASSLKKEAAFRRSVIENVTEGVCVCQPIEAEPGVRVLVWNPWMVAITGYTVDEVNQLGWNQTVSLDEASRAQTAECMQRVRQGENLKAQEWTITRKDGQRRIVLVSTQGVRPEGEDSQILAVMHDVTDERRATRALIDSEERYRRIVETCAEGIWTVDREGRTDFVNRQLAAMLGYSVDEMPGRMLFDFLPESDRAEARELMLRAGFSVERTLMFVHKNGSDVWGRMAASPFLDGRGECLGAIAVVTDITRLREAELDAGRSRALLQAAIEASPAGIIVAQGADAEIILANTAALNMRGGDLSALVSIPAEKHSERWQTYHPDGTPYKSGDLPLARAVFHGETVKGVEVLLRDEDGKERWLLANAAPVRDGDGRIIAGVAVFPDITSRVLAEREIHDLNASLERRVRERTAELDAANRELEGFSFSVSHDLRAPLRGVDGWSLALLEDFGADLDEKAREYLDRIRSETRRMGQLIDDLLRLARLSRGRLAVELVDLSALAERVASRMAEHNPRSNPVKWIIEPGLTAMADEKLVEVALENLLSNAWKFTANTESPRVEFGAAQVGEKTEYFVRDNGAGFDMTFLDKLFRPFQRLHAEAEYAGSGIGLATVQRVIRRHGGIIRAEGAVSAGATFCFTLE